MKKTFITIGLVFLLIFTGINNVYATTSASSGTNLSTSTKKSYEVISCGNIEMPEKTVDLISTFITILQVATPVILIIMGSIDFVKATASSREEDIKKGQQTFVRRLISGVTVFLVILIVKIVIGIISTDSSNTVLNCVNSMLNGTNSSNNTSSGIVGDTDCFGMYEKNSDGNEWKKCVCLDANNGRDKKNYNTTMSTFYDIIRSKKGTPAQVDCNSYD